MQTAKAIGVTLFTFGVPLLLFLLGLRLGRPGLRLRALIRPLLVRAIGIAFPVVLLLAFGVGIKAGEAARANAEASLFTALLTLPVALTVVLVEQADKRAASLPSPATTPRRAAGFLLMAPACFLAAMTFFLAVLLTARRMCPGCTLPYRG